MSPGTPKCPREGQFGPSQGPRRQALTPFQKIPLTPHRPCFQRDQRLGAVCTERPLQRSTRPLCSGPEGSRAPRHARLRVRAAKAVGVAESTIQRAMAVRRADPEEAERVKRRETTIDGISLACSAHDGNVDQPALLKRSPSADSPRRMNNWWSGASQKRRPGHPVPKRKGPRRRSGLWRISPPQPHPRRRQNRRPSPCLRVYHWPSRPRSREQTFRRCGGCPGPRGWDPSAGYAVGGAAGEIRRRVQAEGAEWIGESGAED